MEQITQQQQNLLLLQVLPNKIKVNCATCKKEFVKRRPVYLYSQSKIFYCNNQCFANRERKSYDRVTVNCGTCKKEFIKPLSVYITSETKVFYCNRRCFADRASKWDRRPYKKIAESIYKYDRYYYCKICAKWLLKETAKKDKNDKPMCPDCHSYVKTKSRNPKFRKREQISE